MCTCVNAHARAVRCTCVSFSALANKDTACRYTKSNEIYTQTRIHDDDAQFLRPATLSLLSTLTRFVRRRLHSTALRSRGRRSSRPRQLRSLRILAGQAALDAPAARRIQLGQRARGAIVAVDVQRHVVGAAARLDAGGAAFGLVARHEADDGARGALGVALAVEGSWSGGKWFY